MQKNTTRVYGRSDDLVYFEGVLNDEIGYGNEYYVFSDGTILRIYYAKSIGAIWGIDVVNKGNGLIKLDVCLDEDADIYSDVAHLESWVKFIGTAPDIIKDGNRL